MQNTDTITIEGWMVNELALEGNTLLLYATLYRYSKSSPVVWPLPDLARWLNMSERTAQRYMALLEQNGYLLVDRTNKQQPRIRAIRQLVIPAPANPGKEPAKSCDTPANFCNNPAKSCENDRQILKEERSKEENIQRISSSIDKIEVQEKEKMDDDSFLGKIIAYAASQGQSREMAEAFFHFNETRGWRINGQPISNWQLAFNRWARTYQPVSPLPQSANTTPSRGTLGGSSDQDYLERKHQREREEAIRDEIARREMAAERASPECRAAMEAFFRNHGF